MWNGLDLNMGNLYRLSDAKSRSITPENATGKPGAGAMCELENGSAKNAARDLGKGWKVNPYIVLQPGETAVLADVEGPGCIRHIWMAVCGTWRDQILRMYWDGHKAPSVECPVGDFFCAGWQEFHQISTLAVCVNPAQGFNCYWSMPFRSHCRMTLENRGDEPLEVYYQIDYVLTEIEDDAAYFCAQFRRVNPLPYKEVYTILDGVRGQGHYVGTYLAWGSNSNGWWGEGEVKFYLDGDETHPTICGTGLEDYFGGSHDFEDQHSRDRYLPFSTPYSGFYEVRRDALYQSQMRFGLYRFHIADPIRFSRELRVTVQALGWRSGRRYLPLQDDIASVAFWYQTGEVATFPQLPDRDVLEVI